MNKFFLVLSFVVAFICFHTPCYSQKWVEVVDNDYQLIEADFLSVKRSGNIVSLWNRTSYKSVEAKNSYISKLIKYGIKVDKEAYKNLYYTVALEKFDCISNKSCIVSVVEYTLRGRVINRVDIPESEQQWNDIPPGSLTYAIAYLFCSKYIYEVNNKRYILRIEEIEEFLEKHPKAKGLGTE